MVDFALIPSNTALIIIDMQNCFVQQGYPTTAASSLQLLDRLNALAAICRENGVQVIHTAHVLRPDGSNAGVMGEIIPEIKTGIINKGTESAAFHKNLQIEAGDIILEKPRFGAFHGTDLEMILTHRGIDTVIIGGIATNICCETTAREACARDFKVVFLKDGTSTFGLPDLGMGEVSSEEIQKIVCSTLAFCFGQVLTVEEVIDKLKLICGT